MIRIVPTDHLIGVKLQGDYEDLRELHAALGRYLEFYEANTDFSYSDYEYLLALNYDIRHAFMGTRDIVAVENHYEDYLPLRIAEDHWDELSQDGLSHVEDYKKAFSGNNLYFSVDIVVPLIMYYLSTFQKMLDSYYSDLWFENFNSDTKHYGWKYDRMTAEHDRTQMRLFNAAVWDYLKALLGEEESGILFRYFSYNDEGMIFPGMYINAVLAYYIENAKKLAAEDMNDFIIYIAYGIMDPVSTRYKNRRMLPCHDQYQRVKTSLKGKLTKQLPSYSKYLDWMNRYFAGRTSIYENEFDEFVTKYFGNADWDDTLEL